MAALNKYKIGFIGFGNLAQSILKSLLDSKTVEPKQIAFTNRSEGKSARIVSDFGINYFSGNDELIDDVDIVIIAVKPQDFMEAIEPFVANFREDQIVISLAAGVSFTTLKSIITTSTRLVRVMTNTAASVSAGAVGFYHPRDDEALDATVDLLFKSIGEVYALKDEDEFAAFTVGVCSGIGFVFEIMTYWSEWLEQYGIDKDSAEKMIIDTFRGAVKLSEQSGDLSLTDLQSKVVSKKGVTQAGLTSMNEMELDRIFRVSFEKAIMRDKELEKFVSP